MQFVLLTAVIPRNRTERAMETVKREGAAGLTLLEGQGIPQLRRSPILDLQDSSARHVLMMVLEAGLAARILECLDAELELSRLGNGFAFTLPIRDIAGIKPEQIEHLQQQLERLQRGGGPGAEEPR